MLEIVKVVPESTASRLGLHAGDFIQRINKTEVNDVIDFQFLAADERVTIDLVRRNGRTEHLTVRKDTDDMLGLEFTPLKIKRCRNRCIFCFVDQMPAGSRRTLYIKDDDFRASFLYGNFITLGNLSEDDWDRIFRQRLSPLYISVHSTDPAVRNSLLRNSNAPSILDSLKRLATGGIRMHTQIVLCPGINDGEHLGRTVTDLAGLFPAVSSIAVVPVGITGHRNGLHPLRTFSRSESRAVLNDVLEFGKRFKKELGTRLVYPSDEFFIKAGKPVPSASFYEEFPQIENGVGMVSLFLRDASRVRLPVRVRPVRATLVTGRSFSAILDLALDRLKSIRGITLRKVTANNGFFGESVTVSGLLTGRDVLRALKGKRLGDLVVIPSTMLKEEEAVFLDGMTLEELQQKLKIRISVADGFKDLVNILKKGADA